jgi:DNA replication and repair protein RecF
VTVPLLRLQIENLRCIEHADLRLHPQCNYVFGPNGAGKTSLLESIHVLSRGRSFRTRQTALLVRRGADGFSVYGELADDAERRRVGVGFSRGRLSIRIDGKDAPGSAALAPLTPVHVIDPKLHQLIEAGPSERRRFIDWGVFHVEHGYLDAWRQYRRVLGQRNAALKGGGRGSALSVWTQQLVELGERIDAARSRYVDGLDARAKEVGRQLLGAELQIGYRRGWRRGLTLAEALDEARPREEAQGVTQAGPHRADLSVRVAGGGVRDEVSRGQQKLIVAALVLAQLTLWEAHSRRRGILLVDDPAAELDEAALERLMTCVGALAAQRVVTGLSARGLQPDSEHPVFHVERGRIHPVV